MSIPVKPGIRVMIGITPEEWRMLSHEIDYMLSRAQDLQAEGRLPWPDDEEDVEAMYVCRCLAEVRIRDAIVLSVTPDERTPNSSAYGNFGAPAHYIAKGER